MGLHFNHPIEARADLRAGLHGEQERGCRSSSGYREILGICEGAKEDKTGWSAFLKHLKERGLKGVRLITSYACIGLTESAAEFFPEAAWQRCIVHWYRNIRGRSVLSRSMLSLQKGKTDRARSHPPDCVRTGQARFQPNGVTAECRPLHVQG
jgi:hypothetical protein